ncbi:MAG: cytochrome peroxidase, partial [Moraxellaceae bacterium]|nr:cytochrome peroxidase [Moraxellaceae bacterium]
LGRDDDPVTASPATLDGSLQAVITQQGLDGDAADGQVAVRPASNPMVKLGQLLFFSKTLGGTFDSACASCHHPNFAGGDALSLPVGVSAVNPDFLGPGRIVDLPRDFDPLKDGGPNVPRNSQTVINVGLYRQVMFFDGRVSVLPGAGPSLTINTPESGQGPDLNAGSDLLTAQARFPVASGDEMRNFFHAEFTDPEAFRQLLVARLRGEADTDKLSANGPANWLTRFRAAFGQPDADAGTLITYPNIQTALAAYERSLTFTDTPWKRYVQGETTAIDTASKRGALLFFKPKDQGGLGCVSCHAGDFFTDEKFYNTGFPQIGRGKRPDGRDFGRWQVTKQAADMYAFRVPSLVNVTISAPFGHAGSFQTLPELLRYHANPVASAASYDYTLQHLQQFDFANGNTKTYANAPTYTAEAIASPNLATPLLPGRDLSDEEVTYLVAFLGTLTDTCLAQNAAACLAGWVPSAANDPDGNQLVRSFSPLAPPDEPPPDTTPPAPYPTGPVTLGAVATTALTGFAELDGCASAPATPTNDGLRFVERGVAAGLTTVHGYAQHYWMKSVGQLEQVMMGGGVSAGYLNGDCLPDLILTTGDNPGLVTYANQGGGNYQQVSLLGSGISGLFSGVGFVDLDGDFHREVVLGNLLDGAIRVLKPDADGLLQASASLPMGRGTFGMAFGDVNGDGYPEIYFAHHDYRTLPGTAPAFWRNNAGASLQPADGLFGTSAKQSVPQIWQFAPALLDFDQDGHADLLIAADFLASSLFQNVDKDGSRYFEDVTDRSVVTDENGMGSTFGDYDNDGDLDWFVTSIQDPNLDAEGNWGITGNRLYRNDSTPGSLQVADVTTAANVRDGLWGWGACFADFNNDGWLDLYHVDGFGYVPHEGINQDEEELLVFLRGRLAEFITKPGRLFINDRDGSFTEASTAWQIDLPMDGRGVICSDMDRDGDVDVVVLDHSRTLKLFENRAGHAAGRRFLSLRLQGQAPNTDALGAKVYVTADLDGNGTIAAQERQVRVAMASTLYNAQNTPDLHFGLGTAGSVSELKIVWPDGQEQTFTNVAANQFLVYLQP